MKKIIISILTMASLLAGATLYAGPARPRPFTVAQPDGSTITVQMHGDEFHHWITDASGNRIERGEDGYFHAVTRDETAHARKAAERRRSMNSKRISAPRKSVSGTSDHFLVVLVSFRDEGFTKSAQNFSDMLNKPGYSYNGATGSVLDYFNDNSMGVFQPNFDVVGPVTVSRNANYYGANDTYGDDKHPALAFWEACRELDGEVDFSDYDLDGDGYVDNIFFFYAGYGEADGAPANTIWPHQWYFSEASYYDDGIGDLEFDGVTIESYACSSEFEGNSGAKIAGIGSFCHEFAHVIGLPDFYDIDYEDNGEGIGMLNYSLMDYGNYNNESRTPPYLTAIERSLLGWMEITPWTGSGIRTVPGIQNNVAYRVDTSNDGEFYVFETRNGKGWDSKLIDDYEGHSTVSTGLLVYHVDMSSNKVSGRVTAASLWEEMAINMYGNHQCCYVVSADPDFYYYDEVLFAGSSHVYAFNADTDPAPLMWSGEDAGFGLYDIAFNGNEVTLKLISGTAEPLFAAGINCIANPGQGLYAAGSEFALELTDSSNPPASVKWYFDGAEVSSKVTLASGEHVVNAVLTYGDGTTETLEQKILAE